MLKQTESKNQKPQTLGADVAKNSITFHCTLSGKTVTLDNAKTVLNRLLKSKSGSSLIVEATGGHETLLIEQAMKNGMVVYRVNPFRVRSFMRASGQNAKTDAIDAQALAAYGQMFSEELRPFQQSSPEDKKLRQLTGRRDDLLQMKTQETNRLKSPDNQSVRPSIRTVLSCIVKQIDAIEAEIKDLIDASATLTKKVSVMISVKGIGIVTATNLLAAMPELGTLSRKQVASLAGLAPFAKDSGTASKYRRTGKGRPAVKRILFMAAFAASRYNPNLKIFYNRLIQNGKKPLQALTAVSRKLVTILNAKIRDEIIQQS